MTLKYRRPPVFFSCGRLTSAVESRRLCCRHEDVSSSADSGENSLRQIKRDFLSKENNEAVGSSTAAPGIHQGMEAGLVSSLVWSGVNSRE